MIEWLKTPQDEFWGRYQGRAMCSSRSPRKEAAQWVDSLNLRRDRNDLIVVGLGAGYHLFELLNRFPEKKFVVLDGKENLLESWPQELCRELSHGLDRVRLITGKDSVHHFMNSSKGLSVVRFRSACSEFEDGIFEELLGQSPSVFSKWASAKGYNFAPAVNEIPDALAVNVKTLNADKLAPESREAKLLRALKELVR